VRGIPVTLIEMRPERPSPAHHTPHLGELVCSNSFKSVDPDTAAGTLKLELAALGSMVLATAHSCAVPAGAALAVDREGFACRITQTIEDHPLVHVLRAEATSIPEGDVIVASGPLTSDSLASSLSAHIGASRLAFFDAAAPIVEADTLRRDVIFAASRYGKGSGADYLNCPLDQATYERFIAELLGASRVAPADFERDFLFQACQPIEDISRSGLDALRYGALKPVGLIDPRTGERPYAVVQLRAENTSGSAYNLVGFQTSLTFGEQRRVFGLIPGLEDATFLRYGVMHRNTYVDAPRILDHTLSVRLQPRLRVIGQLAGTEGYLEAAATGLIAALCLSADRAGEPTHQLPASTALGSLLDYATDPATAPYQPMHVNWGLVTPLASRVRGKRLRYAAYAARAALSLAEYTASISHLLRPAHDALRELMHEHGE
jgi:methylenetetrahydrofolate--tRNA-(uracil-5-)-methyltransferase